MRSLYILYVSIFFCSAVLSCCHSPCKGASPRPCRSGLNLHELNAKIRGKRRKVKGRNTPGADSLEPKASAVISGLKKRAKRCRMCCIRSKPRRSAAGQICQMVRLLKAAYHVFRAYPLVKLLAGKQAQANCSLAKRFIFFQCCLGNLGRIFVTDVRVQGGYQHQ